MPDEVLTQNRLAIISSTLSDRDKEILTLLRRCRYMNTKQIQRLLFTDASRPVGLKAANRNLNKLQGLNLIGVLARRIGGARAGSGSRIWYLTDGGERLLRLGGHEGARPRKRFFEPSQYFLSHTLAVTECYVQLSEICGCGDPKLYRVELEPHCWRYYHHNGSTPTLRPDLCAVTHCGKYEDRWFIEMDLSTEAPIRLMEKCQRYHDYYRSGVEQRQHEVFPLVVWIVPSAARKESVIAHIKDEFKKQPRIFTVITPDELERLIRQGDGAELC